MENMLELAVLPLPVTATSIVHRAAWHQGCQRCFMLFKQKMVMVKPEKLLENLLSAEPQRSICADSL